METMSAQLDQAMEAISRQGEKIAAERAEVTDAFNSFKAQIGGLRGQVSELKTQVESLLTEPPAELDLSPLLAKIEEINEEIEGIYVPEIEPATEAELVGADSAEVESVIEADSAIL